MNEYFSITYFKKNRNLLIALLGFILLFISVIINIHVLNLFTRDFYFVNIATDPLVLVRFFTSITLQEIFAVLLYKQIKKRIDSNLKSILIVALVLSLFHMTMLFEYPTLAPMFIISAFLLFGLNIYIYSQKKNFALLLLIHYSFAFTIEYYLTFGF